MKFQILKKALKRAKDLKNFFCWRAITWEGIISLYKKACSMLNFSNLCFLTLFINILFFCSERQHYNLFLVFTPSSDVMNWVLLFMYLLVYLKKGGKFKFEIYQASLRHHLSQNATKKSVSMLVSFFYILYICRRKNFILLSRCKKWW